MNGRPHAFERNSLSPEECRECGRAFEDHPHKFAESSCCDNPMECEICGYVRAHPIHGNPDRYFSPPDDEQEN